MGFAANQHPVSALGPDGPYPAFGMTVRPGRPRWRLHDPHVITGKDLAEYLRSTTRRYDDVPELELRDASDKPVAEADLIAVSNDEVIAAEVKSNNTLGNNPREVKHAAAKRVRLGDVLRADQIILATT
jgi:hypothetical protein